MSAPVPPSAEWARSERLPVEVRLDDGTSAAGDLHLMSRAAQHEGPETPLELLNRDEPFLPFTHRDGAVEFLPRAGLAWVACASARLVPDPVREHAAKQLPIDVTLRDGSVLRGWAFVELPPTRARALDYLNTNRPFFAVWTPDTTWFVHHAQVRRVRPLE